MQSRYLSNVTQDLSIVDTGAVVIGSGIGGLFAAHCLSEHKDVVLVTKRAIAESNTNYAQGGIAAAISEKDSPELHRKDTLYAGVDLCDEQAVEILVNEGPQRILELIELGTRFDMFEGELALAKEGAHSCRRILRARGDATGAEIVRALVKAVRKNHKIEKLENHFAIDVITESNQIRGVLVQDDCGEVIFYRTPIVVLATGGIGQLFRYTTNPDIATGDGVAIAYRAGAVISNLEFYQFHPTVLSYPGAPRFLISEAVRGEGALLRNIHGERFMVDRHEMAELAPRDVVARCIVEEMERTKATYVFLDITHEKSDELYERFPTIYEKCLQYGLDISSDWIPVAPAAHYAMGGVRTNEWGETEVRGLFACGEVACTGVHGANRLASNSLSEALVYARRIATKAKDFIQDEMGHRYPYQLPNLIQKPNSKLQYINERRLRLQKLMLRYVGLKRNKEGLLQALEDFKKFSPMEGYAYSQVSEFEFMNLLTCATLMTMGALARTESRGAHYRLDYPQTENSWQKVVSIHKERGVTIDDINF
ncbi:L-aspartate oxidase [Desulfuribacillus stibiiarsenatis]|uniref:L-aspartate oxidase n=1 Tax=Desulfuribacillus stibiiarsenatis TaxID=1390249 RepID=A0A1E5L2H5_9FIRM|nr:L-aspartate oxidase [Desulfuribacillus stibiiarsenatis]OEH84362.1 L-aspartate oxidase [Desulfuribacillus stibiiarsenatis]